MDSKTEIKYVVLDLDGTLLNDEHKLSEKNKESVKKAVAQGVKVMIATGKTRTAAEGIIKELGLLDVPSVCVQGLIVYNADGSVRQEQTLDGNAARKAIQFAESQGFDVIAYSGKRLVIKNLTDAAKEIASYGEPMPEAIGSLLNHIGKIPMHKLIIVGGNSKKLPSLRWQLNQQIGEQVSFTHGGVLSSLEVLPKGMSKAVGVKAMLRTMGASPEQTLAIGDGENDIDMLKLVGIGVAVGNAGKEVKAAAKYTVKSNNEDGVAEALERFVLKAETKTPEAPKAETKVEEKISAAPDTSAKESPAEEVKTEGTES